MLLMGKINWYFFIYGPCRSFITKLRNKNIAEIFKESSTNSE